MFRKSVKSAFIITILCLIGTICVAAETGKTGQGPTQADNPEITPVTKAVVNAGALSCAERVNKVVNFLTAGSEKVGVQAYVPSANPDRSLISISLEIQNKNLPVAYASTCFAPNQANGCGAMYETVMYWKMSCADVALKQFSGLKKLGPMTKEIVVLDGGPEMKVFLMPAGTGCISIKKEIMR